MKVRVLPRELHERFGASKPATYCSWQDSEKSSGSSIAIESVIAIVGLVWHLLEIKAAPFRGLQCS